jgi:phospholipid/cholesterol/gamma-HCH transport system substrate-binding protein
MVGVLLRDKQSADRLKNTIINLNEGSIKLNEDLEAAQHNFLLRGYFKQKDKEAEKEAARQVDSMKKAQKGQ